MKLPQIDGLTDAQVLWTLRHAGPLERLQLVALLALIAVLNLVALLLPPWRRR